MVEIDADIDRFERAGVKTLRGLQPRSEQFVGDGRAVQIAILATRNYISAPALGAARANEVKVSVVQGVVELRDTHTVNAERQRIGSPRSVVAGTGIAFNDLVGTVDARVTYVGHKAPAIIGRVVGVETECLNFAGPGIDVIANDTTDIGELALGDHAVFNRIPWLKGRRRPLQRKLDAPQDLGVVELGIEGVQRSVPAIVRAEFEHAHIAVTLQL